MRGFKSPDRNQLLVLPPNLNDWLRPDHPARLVLSYLEEIDLSRFYAAYTSAVGQPPYDPKMMLAIILYAAVVNITSSRKIEERLEDDIAFRFLTAGLHPDHDTIADFRKRHAGLMEDVFVGGVRLAIKSGMATLNHAVIDGTKMQANAAKGKRMSKKELKQETDHIKHLVGKFFEESEKTDREEDEKFGKGRNPFFLPKHLQDEEALRQWVKEALREESNANQAEPEEAKPAEDKITDAEKRARRKAKKLKKASDSLDEQVQESVQKDPTGRRKREREKRNGEPEVPTVNMTDPDCRRMRFANGRFGEAYNCQIVVDDNASIILAADVVQDKNDQRQLLPMAEQVRNNTGWLPAHFSGDTGYFNVRQMNDPRLKSVEFWVPPKTVGKKEGAQTDSQAMRDKMDTELGRRLSGLRKSIVEPVFGAIKYARKFNRLVMRGKRMVRAEWLTWCTAHNLLKMHKAGILVTQV